MIPTTYVLALSLILFFVGLLGVLIRRNAFIVMMSVELMLNAVNVALLGFARARGDVHAHGLVFFIIAIAAAEAAVGLAIVIAIFRTRRTVNVDEINLMRN